MKGSEGQRSTDQGRAWPGVCVDGMMLKAWELRLSLISWLNVFFFFVCVCVCVCVCYLTSHITNSFS